MSTPYPTLAPSLLDRLVDACCGVAEPRPGGVGSLADDIEDLLNTCSVAAGPKLAGCPEASESLLTYGAPPPTSLSLATNAERLATARQLEQTIARFEPRLENVRVRAEAPNAVSNEGRFEIRGALRAEPGRAFTMMIRVRSTSGRTHVTTERA
ncbi:lysozyme-like protein [Posidoniimonas polymericola]|uniref:Lysozyme-like protein n=1 Tax=Posidoniimonas polymericola TaxID=2528002 RepID=A0A5C5YL76_9BACT|nr:type VI secretion system baseplate subunit TssE [Posidoniimonas polymericola]TWT75604.1 lysozyme-like protein [Posidoniimonas polymericola]